MKLSKKSEYGVRALVEIAMRSRNGEGWYQIAQIAEASQIPEKFLEQILLALKNGGILKSRRGIEGGYSLNTSPEDIHMDQIVRLLDGFSLNEEAKSAKEDEKLDVSVRIYNQLVRKAHQASLDILHKVSLNDLVEQVKKQRVVAGESLEYQI
ncbi:MAG: Rrf2 family transcriptional regulator [Verrucomicrobiales bacterium]|nr:Rrf2 family transcriptional regulator [Verrucomicrobiales bacterium]